MPDEKKRNVFTRLDWNENLYSEMFEEIFDEEDEKMLEELNKTLSEEIDDEQLS